MGKRLIVPILVAFLAGCAAAPEPEAPAAEPTEAGPVLANLSLRRVGGIAGFDDRILINGRGQIVTSGRAWGMRQGQLSPAQMGELAGLFHGFEQLDPAYPPPEGVRDDVQYQITYGAHVVRASMANEQLPPKLRAIIQALEQRAAELPGR